MSKTIRKIFAVILLALLIGLPFIDWKLGAVLWMCAWLVFILQKLFGHQWTSREGGNKEDIGHSNGQE